MPHSRHLVGLDRHPYHGLVSAVEGPVSDVAGRLAVALTGRYAIERELGHGGTALVFLGRDPKHERLVAIKVLRPELAVALGAERFLREIKLTARLNHPHILPLLDSGEAAGLFYLVLPPSGGSRRPASRSWTAAATSTAWAACCTRCGLEHLRSQGSPRRQSSRCVSPTARRRSRACATESRCGGAEPSPKRSPETRRNATPQPHSSLPR